MKKRASWNGAILAESDDLVNIEGNYYFPSQSLNKEYFSESTTNTVCPWKGTASYHNINVDGKVNGDAAWFYSDPKDAAIKIKDRVAFWKGVVVEDV